MICMHKFPNLFHIFGGDSHGRSSRSLVVFKGRSAAFGTPMPLEILCTTHCIIAASLPKHVQCLCDRFAQLTQNSRWLIVSPFCPWCNRRLPNTCDHKNTNIINPDVNTVTSLSTILRRLKVASATLCCHLLARYRAYPETFDTALYIVNSC
jgi:hypothetical protein